MANKHSRAKVALVSIRSMQFQGLMDDKGDFYVAIPQIADLIQTSRNTASRDLKRLMGADFETSTIKMSTEFNQRPINVIPERMFEQVLAEFAFAGNPIAQDLIRALAGMSMHQLFCDAFGVKFDAEDRQAFLVERMASRSVRTALEKAIAHYIDRHPELSENEQSFLYINATQKLYCGLWGKHRKAVAADYGLTTGDDLRSHLPLHQLSLVKTIEELAARLIYKLDMGPMEAVMEAISRSLSEGAFADQQ